MIISHHKKFIFIHNYKVAGTSVRDALNIYNNNSFKESRKSDKVKLFLKLYPNIYSNQFSWHVSAKEVKSKIPEKIFKSYYKFGFVRNPWDWQVSLYTYILKSENHYQHKLIKSMKTFDEYIDWRVHNDLLLQKDFFYENDACLMDFIGKMENLQDDFLKISSRININSELSHLNASRKKDDNYINYHSQKSIDLINEAFSEDIKLFNYSKPKLELLSLNSYNRSN